MANRVVLGIGVDLIYIQRIEAVVRRWGDRFLRRAYHPEELVQYRSATEKKRYEFLASRWAVKEAVFKAIPSGARLSFPEIVLRKDEHRRPKLHFHDLAARHITAAGISATHVSISHDKDHAIAYVILEGEMSKD